MAASDCEISTESEDAEDFAEDSTAGKLLPSDVANGSSDSGSDRDDESELGKVQRLSSVRRAVRTKRTNMTSISFPLCPVPLTGSLGSLTSLCDSKFLPDRRHNYPADDFHLDSY
jgi:hypothetical protein